MAPAVKKVLRRTLVRIDFFLGIIEADRADVGLGFFVARECVGAVSTELSVMRHREM